MAESKKQPERVVPGNEVVPATLEQHVRVLSEKLAPRDGDHISNLDRAAAYIRGSLTAAGGRISEQVFEIQERDQRNALVSKGPYRNVIASFGPATGERLIIGAHYDAAGTYPGADDNASGVAALLEVAKLLGQNPPSLRTDLVAYTLEEPPYFGSDDMGSAKHAASLVKEGVSVRWMMCLEMLGYYSDAPRSQRYPLAVMKLFYPTRGNFLALVGRFGKGGLSRRLKKRMKSGPLPITLLNAPASLPGVDFSDHRNYWRHGFPAVMLTDTAFYRNPNYHTPDDTAEKLDYRRMTQAVKAVYAAIEGEK